MIIGVTDPDKFKFSQQLIDHWKSQGHDVRQSMYHEPKFVEECDVVFYDYASMMVGELAKYNVKPKKCIVRSIDVENYMNYFDRFNNSNLIDHFIFLNESQRKLLEEKGFKLNGGQIHIIPPGVNLNKYTLTDNDPEMNIKMVFVGRFWIGKNVLGALEIAYLWWHMGKKVELHLCGLGLDPRWWKKRVEHAIEQAPFKVEITEWAEDMNKYLDDKDVMVVPSFKEAFSYVTAEAMAKGIPVLNANWYGSHDVWPKWMIYNNLGETWDVYQNILRNHKYKLRSFIRENYDEEIMFKRIDELL